MRTRGDHRADVRRKIVVGVDGSPASLAALRWAADNAPRWRASVEAVLVYSAVPALVFAPAGAGALAITGGDEDLVAAASAQLAAAVALVPLAHPVVQRVLPAGHPWQALVEASTDALMLVVGRRHHHPFDAFIGSTGRSCLSHAHCPVLIVPEDEPRDLRP